MLLSMLLSLAEASPPLIEAEARALDIIEACRLTLDCGHDRRDLAEAFLLRATAAAVLRGELDPTAAANVAALDPELADRWIRVLSSASPGAEPWVRAFLQQPLSPEPPLPEPTLPEPTLPEPPLPEPPLPEPPLPEPTPPEASAPDTRPTGPAMIRVVAVGGRVRGGSQAEVEGELRARVTGPLAVIARLGIGGASRLVPGDVGGEIDRLGEQFGSACAGIALRATPSRGTELFGYVGPLVASRAVTWSSHQFRGPVVQLGTSAKL